MCQNFWLYFDGLFYVKLGKTTNNGNRVEVKDVILDDAALFKEK